MSESLQICVATYSLIMLAVIVVFALCAFLSRS